MTRLYLESVASRSSSMGGLVMPIGFATVPDTLTPSRWDSLHRRTSPGLQQGYQRVGRTLDVVVHDHALELVLGGHLDAGDVEPPTHPLGVLGAAPGQAA